jgi:hypothetical protein
MRTKRIKQLFQAAGAGSVLLGVGFVGFGLWVAFFQTTRYGLEMIPNLASCVICLAIASLLMRFGRDMITYYRIK